MREDRTPFQLLCREYAVANYLNVFGWQYLGKMLFKSPNKKTIHDFSAADMTKHEIIEEKGFFIVDPRVPD